MSTSKLVPFNDPRVSLRSANLNGYNYGYLYSAPSGPKKDTIILIHGFPDMSFGWRYQIPFLVSLGLEVFAIDCLGYGRSDAPPSSQLSAYSYRRVSDDIAELCRQQHIESVVLGGHDWGGAIVYRVAQYHPTLIKAFFAICTPYQPPTPVFTPLQLVVDNGLSNFAYQLHFASGEVEHHVQSPQEIRQFLSSLYGGRAPNKRFGFDVEKGVQFENLPDIGKSPLLSDDEMDLYVREYSRHGINGPLNWYRSREVNFVDEWDFFFHKGKKIPKKGEEVEIRGVEVLFVQATKDAALKPFMAKKMDQRIEKLTWKTLPAGHWALWEKPDECNQIIKQWLEEKVWSERAQSKL